MTPILTVIMCAYNEMGRIQPALEDLLASVKRNPEKVEIIILDNCSTDGTREWLKSLSIPNVRVEFNERNLGKGGSIKKGFSLSRGHYVVIHDPDMEYRAKDIWPLLKIARQNGAGIVLGSRILGGNVRYKYLCNYLGVQFLTKLINFLYGCRLTDTATALKLIDGDLAKRLNLKCGGFDLDFELVTKVLRMGRSVIEGTADYYPRSVMEGKKIRPLRDGLLALKIILLDRFLPRPKLLKTSTTFSGTALERDRKHTIKIKVRER